MITGKTGVFGIMGDPVEHSLSPPMHNAAFLKLSLDNVYVPFHVKKNDLQSAISGAASMGIKGLNVTIPHKTEVIKYLDYIDPTAKLIGAVNTIKFDENGIKGYNTDGRGAVKAIEEFVDIKNKKVIILGAGGAARAISFQMLLEGAGSILIANRTVEKAVKIREDITEKLNADVKAVGLDSDLEEQLENADILVNATPIGMYPHVNQKPLVTADMMHEGLVVNDVIYNPLKTGLLKEAEKAGAKGVSGAKMLIYQGVESFRIWTGIEPPVKVFEEALMEELKNKC